MKARVLVIVAVVLLGAACDSEDSGPGLESVANAGTADYEYVVPAGTADRLAAGDPVEIIPAQLDVRVGETIRIVNQDDEGHFVGIFYVDAGETATQRFASPGEFVGECTIHPSGQITLTVHE